MTRLILVALMAAALAGSSASAEDAAPAPSTPAVPPTATPAKPDAALPPAPDGRYAMHRVNDALIRLDSRTGQVSVCGPSANGWSCRAVPDDRAALENEIGRLQGENATLKKELLAHNLSLPSGIRPPGPGASAQPATPDRVPDRTPNTTPETRLPTEAEIDRAMTILSKAWRRMVEMMVDLQREVGRPNSGSKNLPPSGPSPKN